MQKKLIGVCAVALVLALLLTLAPSCGKGEVGPGVTPTPGTPGVKPTPTPQAKTLKIGSMNILSGPAAPWGVGMDTGAKWAADDINAAGGMKVGKDTYMIKVISCDTKATGSVAAECATRMVYDEGIHYVVGPLGTCQAIIPILEEGKCFSTGSAQAGCLGPQHPYFFDGIIYYAAWSKTLYEQVVEHHPEFKGQNWAILTVDSAGNRENAGYTVEAAKAVGLTVVATEYYAGGTTDFYPVLTRVLAKNPLIIEPPASAGDGAMITRQARDLGYTGWFVHPNWVPMDLLLNTVGLDNMYKIITTLPNFEGPFYSDAMKQLVRRYMALKARPGETDMPDTVVHGYSQMIMYKTAIEKAGSIDPDEVMKVFDDPNFRFERYYHPDGALGGFETFGIRRQLTHFNPYGELVIEGGKATVVQMGGKVVLVP